MIRINITDIISVEYGSGPDVKLLIFDEPADAVYEQPAIASLTDIEIERLINGLQTLLIAKKMIDPENDSRLADPSRVVKVLQRLIRGDCLPTDDIQPGETL